MLVRSLPMKSRKGLARDAFDRCAAHSGLVHDVIDTDAEHKMAAFMVVFSPLSDVDLCTNNLV